MSKRKIIDGVTAVTGIYIVINGDYCNANPAGTDSVWSMSEVLPPESPLKKCLF